ncbi:MAG: hypothetical protein AAF715_00350 [Myxococcota bacterium]
MSSTFVEAAVGVTVVLTAVEARADHDDPAGPQLTDDTAFTVPEGDVKLGLLTLEYGLLDQLQVGTIHLFDLVLFPNALVEWQPLRGSWGAVSLAGGAAYVHTRLAKQFFEDLPIADLLILPVEVLGTFSVHPQWSITAGTAFTGMFVEGTFNDDDFAGAAAVSNLQLHATLEWRISSLVAMQLHGRYLVFQTAGATAEADVMADDFTSIRAVAVAESDILDFPHAFQVVPRFHFSWRTFNLAAGVGYGNPVIPFVNFVLPDRFVLPELDFYWRF